MHYGFIANRIILFLSLACSLHLTYTPSFQETILVLGFKTSMDFLDDSQIWQARRYIFVTYPENSSSSTSSSSSPSITASDMLVEEQNTSSSSSSTFNQRNESRNNITVMPDDESLDKEYPPKLNSEDAKKRHKILKDKLRHKRHQHKEISLCCAAYGHSTHYECKTIWKLHSKTNSQSLNEQQENENKAAKTEFIDHFKNCQAVQQDLIPHYRKLRILKIIQDLYQELNHGVNHGDSNVYASMIFGKYSNPQDKLRELLSLLNSANDQQAQPTPRQHQQYNNNNSRLSDESFHGGLLEQTKIENYARSFVTLIDSATLIWQLNEVWKSSKISDMGLIIVLVLIIINLVPENKVLKCFCLLLPFSWYRYLPGIKYFILHSPLKPKLLENNKGFRTQGQPLFFPNIRLPDLINLTKSIFLSHKYIEQQPK